MSQGFQVRRATDAESDLNAVTAIVNTVMPDFATSIEEMRGRLGYRPKPDLVVMRGPLLAA